MRYNFAMKIGQYFHIRREGRKKPAGHDTGYPYPSRSSTNEFRVPQPRCYYFYFTSVCVLLAGSFFWLEAYETDILRGAESAG